MNAWLSLEAMRIWIDHGPSRVLLGSASYTASHAIELCGDYAAGYRTAQRLLAVGRVRAYEPGLSEASFVSAVISGQPAGAALCACHPGGRRSHIR
jgi:hypothetical protein